LSTPYHLKTNGLVERFNRTLYESLAKLNEEKENWDKYILPTLFAYRIKVNKNTQFIPFYLTYRWKATLLFDDNTKGEIFLMDRVKEISIELIQARKKEIENIEMSQSKQKKYHNGRIKRNQI